MYVYRNRLPEGPIGENLEVPRGIVDTNLGSELQYHLLVQRPPDHRSQHGSYNEGSNSGWCLQNNLTANLHSVCFDP